MSGSKLALGNNFAHCLGAADAGAETIRRPKRNDLLCGRNTVGRMFLIVKRGAQQAGGSTSLCENISVRCADRYVRVTYRVP